MLLEVKRKGEGYWKPADNDAGLWHFSPQVLQQHC